MTLRVLLFTLSYAGLAGCGALPFNSHTNDPANGAQTDVITSTSVCADHRGDARTMAILALSGGGSRAAYFSTKVMYELDKLGILKEVDAISSVSGGSLAAAYYAITEDNRQPGSMYRNWQGAEQRTLAKMRKNYIWRWFGNWFWPHNIARFWFTKFDRTDIMAQTFADNLFDRPGLGRDYKIKDLNPERPYLVLNSTNATQGRVIDGGQAETAYKARNMELVSTPSAEPRGFGAPFRFTKEYFDSIDSDIGEYSLARAVMATATFPAVFNYMTLRDNSPNGQYLHLFDGGTHDNQGLTGVEEILLHSKEMYDEGADCNTSNDMFDKVIVILVDAYTGKAGVDASRADGRSMLDFIVDTNFIDATDSLLFANRKARIENFYEQTLKDKFAPDKSIYYHITFDQAKRPGVSEAAKNVPTSFALSEDNAKHLRSAAEDIINSENSCIAAIVELIKHGTHSGESDCHPD